MIPILFDGINKDYREVVSRNTRTYQPTNYGYIGKLFCVSATITEERNGIYDLDIDYPLQAPYIDYIIPGNLILAAAPPLRRNWNNWDPNNQFFRIYDVSRGIDRLRISCHHISYELSWKPVDSFEPYTNIPPLQALSVLVDNTPNCTFGVNVDGTFSRADFKYLGPASLRKYIGGMEGSVIDLYGGECWWNNYSLYLFEKRGRDFGFRIKYGRNMTDFTQDISNEETYPAALAFVEKDGQYVYARASLETETETTRYNIIDFSNDYSDSETLPTQAELEQKALDYLNNNNTNIMDVSVQLGYAFEGYLKEKGMSEVLSLCDTVTLLFEPYKIATKLKVVKVVYDVLAERNISIELNQPKQTLADTIALLQINQQDIGNYKTQANANRAAAQAANILLGNEQEER